MKRVKVLVVPVYQKHWLYACDSGSAAATQAVPGWRQGTTLGEKAQLLQQSLNNKFKEAAQKQWQALEAAQEGTFKNKLLRLAKWVLSKEDPIETFLKAVPRQPVSLEVVYPASMKEVLIRRRLRRLVNVREHIHQRRILGWALASLPQLPLMLTPLPNVTLYFSIYKLVSQYQAVQGCRALQAAFAELDQEQRRKALQRASQGPWPVRIFRRGGTDDDVPKFKASKDLDKIIQPLDRWSTPLSEEAAKKVAKLLELEQLPELVARTRSWALQPAAS